MTTDLADALRWKKIATRRLVHDRWLTLDSNDYETTAGRIDNYYLIDREDIVLVVAQHRTTIAMIRQYRPATDEFYWCLPAGYKSTEESVENAARRELSEETGLSARTMACVGTLDILPAYLRCRAHVVACTEIEGVLTRPESEEAISEVAWVERGEVMARIRDGRINEMQAVAALMLADLHNTIQNRK